MYFMKNHITLTIDVDVILELKEKKVNVSNLVNDFLKEYVGIKEGEELEYLSQVDLELLKAQAHLLNLKNRRKELENKGQKIIY
jgi:hypothetical protein